MNADLDRCLALAQTPKTRARIRRWALLKRVCFILAILGACVFVLVLVGFLPLAFAGSFVPDLRIFTDAPWWVVPAALAALLAAILPWCVAGTAA